MNRFEFYGNIEAYKRHRDELKHYGTIGQKWGVRKWQNPDGTFNEAGKERYFGSNGKKSSGLEKKMDKMTKKASKMFNTMYDNMDPETIKKQQDFMNNFTLNVNVKNNDNQKIGSIKDFTAKNFVMQNDRHVFKKVKKNPEYYNTEGLTDDEIMEAIRRVEKHNPYKNYGVSLRDEIYRTKMNKDINKYVRSNTNVNPQEIEDMVKKVNDVNPSQPTTAEMQRMGSANGINIKDLKKQAKDKGIGILDRKKLAKWCAENGVDEITDEIAEGYKAGDNFKKNMNDYFYNSDGGDQITTHFKKETAMDKAIKAINDDKNVKKFKESNENYKKFSKDYDKVWKKSEDMNKDIVAEMKKRGYDIPLKKVEINGKTYELIDNSAISKKYGINILNECNKLRSDLSKSKYTAEVVPIVKDARKNLSKFEADAQKWATNYLNANAYDDMPGDYSYTFDLKTNKTRKTNLSEGYSYYMNSKYWENLGGP